MKFIGTKRKEWRRARKVAEMRRRFRILERSASTPDSGYVLEGASSDLVCALCEEPRSHLYELGETKICNECIYIVNPVKETS